MPYCKIAFSIPIRDDVLPTLSTFTKQHFVQGQAAYEIDTNRFAIDAGENDVRALYDVENGLVKFFCRYEEVMAKSDKQFQQFTVSHDIKWFSHKARKTKPRKCEAMNPC